jgi:RimJ/RimL family protein N-acetyltransferase
VSARPLAGRLETARLVLTPEEPADAPWLAELFTSRGAGVVSPAEAADRVAAVLDAERRLGYGVRVLRDRVDGAPLGYVALVVGRSTPEEPELAYELLPAARGRGLATEAAQALVTAAAEAGLTRLWSTVRDWNTASLRVLAKVGFTESHRTRDDAGVVVWLTRAL